MWYDRLRPAADLPPFRRFFSVPPMPDRLAELRRQRALIQEHLAWLDREVAALERHRVTPAPTALEPVTPAPFVVGVNTVSATVKSAPASTLSTLSAGLPAAPAIGSTSVPAADDILEQYRVEPTALKQDIRKGCFLYFAAAMALLVMGVLILYFALRK